MAQDAASVGTGATLRGLDKHAGTVVDLPPLRAGETVGLGWLQITLAECRYPPTANPPSGDAFAYLVIREEAGEAAIFEGWMVASSPPALNALDHGRYDVWVLNCTTE